MTRFAFIAALAAVACTGDEGKSDSGSETGTTTEPTELLVESYSVSCNADNSEITYSATTSATGYDGLVYQQETGSSYMKDGALLQFSDEHDLTSSGTSMSITVADGGGLDAVRNVDTLFDCELHINEPDWMTYAFGVYDDAGVIADCLAGGGDAPGLIDGTYTAPAVNAPSADFDLSACVAASGAR